MICQRCGRKAEPDAKFCVDCGSPLVLRCPACQTPYDPGSRFCSLCGRSLPEAVQSSESAQKVEFEHPLQAEPQVPLGQPSEPAPGSLSCPRCHQNNTSDADYCFACGMPLEGPSGTASSVVAPVALGSEKLAGFWERLVAYLVDNVLITVASAITYGAFSLDPSGGLEPQHWMALISLVYFTPLIAIRATTIGKSFLGVYVVRTDGSRVGLGRAFFRTLATFLSGIILGLGFLQAAFREDKRALHDLICDTKVIKSDRRPFG